MTNITPSVSSTARVGQLAASLPGASRVFMRHRVDFCCAGGRTLGEACQASGLDADAILAEIEAESVLPGDDAAGWQRRSLSELIEHIVTAYHRPLEQELPRLQSMADKVLRVHGERDPQRLEALTATLRRLTHDLTEHMSAEEQVVFPWIMDGLGQTAGAPVQAMLDEHDEAGELLERIRELTDEFNPPRGACATWRALWSGLEQLDAALRVHIHLENNVLFPRALAGEDPRRVTS